MERLAHCSPKPAARVRPTSSQLGNGILFFQDIAMKTMRFLLGEGKRLELLELRLVVGYACGHLFLLWGHELSRCPTSGRCPESRRGIPWFDMLQRIFA